MSSTPLDVAEFELELLAFNTRPRIRYLPGSRAPVPRLKPRLLDTSLEFPATWLAAEPTLRLRARRKNAECRRRSL